MANNLEEPPPHLIKFQQPKIRFVWRNQYFEFFITKRLNLLFTLRVFFLIGLFYSLWSYQCDFLKCSFYLYLKRMKKYLYSSTIIFYQSSHIYLKELWMATFLNILQFIPVCNFIIALRQVHTQYARFLWPSFFPLTAVCNSSRIEFLGAWNVTVILGKGKRTSHPPNSMYMLIRYV